MYKEDTVNFLRKPEKEMRIWMLKRESNHKSRWVSKCETAFRIAPAATLFALSQCNTA
jgi:hypothetical protein